MQILQNKCLRITVNELGAELTTMTDRRDGAEYVWSGDPNYWKRHAPLLFPVIGRLKDGRYTTHGENYAISQHGFGRDLPFAAEKKSDTVLEMTLRQSEYTKKMYPWDFTLVVRYTLEDNTLRKEHIVRNDSDTPMWYEIGGHDAFNLCLTADDTVEGSYVQFEGADEVHPIMMDEAVMITRLRGTLPLQNGRLYLTAETFRHDVLALDRLAEHRVVLGSDRRSRRLAMEFDDFPFFALWSTYKGTPVPYVCLEPWSTLPDGQYLDYALENKVGVRRLAPGKQETLAYSVTVED